MSTKRKPTKKGRKGKSIRKKGRVLSVLALALLLCIGLFVVIYLQFFMREVVPVPAQPETIGVNFYFRSADGEWGQEERSIELSENRTEVVQSVLQGLVEGPRSAAFVPVLPENVGVEDALLRIGSEENTLTITFASSFSEITPPERIVATASFVWTLTELDFVHHVLFYIGESPMQDGDGNNFGPRNRQNTTLEETAPTPEEETATIILYFPNDQLTGLVAEEREITINPINPQQDIERIKVLALIEGPRNPDLFGAIPSDVTVNRAERNGDTVTVDFGEEFLTAISGGSRIEEMAIFSLVNTLTERPDIRRVQISVGGMQIQPDETGEFHIDLSGPFERDESLILAE